MRKQVAKFIEANQAIDRCLQITPIWAAVALPAMKPTRKPRKGVDAVRADLSGSCEANMSWAMGGKKSGEFGRGI